MGSILLILSAVPAVGFVLGIAGFVLVLIAVKYIADNVGDQSIFNNALYFVVIAVIGFLIALFLFFAAIFPFLGPGLTPPTGIPDFNDPDVLAALAIALLGLAIGWILLIVASLFLRRSFNSISEHLGVPTFGTAALLYFIGAILLIAFGFGVLLIFVAEVLMIVAFFSIPDQLPAPAMAQPPPPA